MRSPKRRRRRLYVVSHHVVDYGLLNLKEFVEIAHAKGVPVIVDAASEYDLRIFLEQGADIALYSGHKFLGGPTSGIVAGKKELVRNAFLQNMGIGRGMKVGKESIFGVMAALKPGKQRDHAGIRERETGYLNLWKRHADGRPGVTALIEPDPTNNPLDRMRVIISAPEAHITAWDLADALARGTRRSSSAIMRLSIVISISIPATCIRARKRSLPAAWRRTRQGAGLQRDHRDAARKPQQAPFRRALRWPD
jgi:seryl-tRNA(Sec) selenium transferase